MNIFIKTFMLSMLGAVSLVSLLSCHKSGDAAPENILTNFVGYSKDSRPAVVLVNYNQNRFLSKIEFFLGNNYTQQFTYNSINQLTDIKLTSTDLNPSESYEYKVNYERELPISGTRKYSRSASITSRQEYTIDSAIFHVSNGKVVRITYFDSKVYDFLTKQLLRSKTDTVENCQFYYVGDDLVKVNTNRGPRDYTYGTKKGVGSANRFKFLLFPEVNPLFYSAHDMLTVIGWKDTASQTKTEYVNKYNSAGYPNSSTVNKASGYGVPQFYENLEYVYK